MLDQVGEGATGIVFKARQLHLDRIVALKVIRKEYLAHADTLRRFHREARAAARVAHPNVVTLYDAGQAGDWHYLVMEFVDGIDLGRWVHEGGRLPIGVACDYIRQASLGLQHAHERGLVHRDIKPGNLLVTPDGHVKILDLGLARLEQSTQVESDRSELTLHGALMGTPDYLAPEQARDSRAADVRSDLYSMGCTLYFLLTGQAPFPGGSLTEKLVKHALHEPKPVEELRTDVPPSLRAIVQRLMAKEPRNRLQTAGELAAALEPFARRGEQPIQTTDSGAQRRRKRILAGVGSVLLLSILGIGVWIYSQWRSPPPAPVSAPFKSVKKTEAVDLSGPIQQIGGMLTRVGGLKKAMPEIQIWALRAQARANARLQVWAELERNLAALDARKVGGDDHLVLWKLLAQEAGADKQKPEASADRQKQELADFLGSVEIVVRKKDADWEPWEVQQLVGLRTQAAVRAWKIAQHWRRPASRDKPFQEPYEGEQRLKDVLKKAYDLVGPSQAEPALRHELALADGWYESENPAIASLLSDVSTINPSFDDFPFLYVKARTQPADFMGRKTAVACYAALWRLLGDVPADRVKDSYRRVLKQGIQKCDDALSEKADSDLWKVAAGLYLAKANLISQHPALNPEEWSANDAWDCYERAVELNPDLESLKMLHKKLSERLKVAANGIPDHPLAFEKAVARLKENKDPTKEPGFGHFAKGLALEDRSGVHLEDRSGIPQKPDLLGPAIAAFAEAIRKDQGQPVYFLHRGRCYVKRFRINRDANDRTMAINDFRQAIAKKRTPEQEMEAYFWLGWAILKGSPLKYPEAKGCFAKATGLAQGPTMRKVPDADELESLTEWSEYNYNQAGDLRAKGAPFREEVEEALAGFESLNYLANKGPAPFRHRLYAANRLESIGYHFFEAVNKPVEALTIYDKGLPAPGVLLTETKVEHARLLLRRTALFVNPGFKEELQRLLKEKYPARQDLIKQAEHGIELTKKGELWNEEQRAEACYFAAFIFQGTQKTNEAVTHLEEAIRWLDKALQKATKGSKYHKELMDRKQKYEDLLRTWRNP
jgi:serine/threonine protein kinase